MTKRAAGVYSPALRALQRPDRIETNAEIAQRYFEDVAYFHINKAVKNWRTKEWKEAAGILAIDVELRKARQALVMARVRGLERENVLLKGRKQIAEKMLKGEGDQQRSMNKIANELAIEQTVLNMLAEQQWAQAKPGKIAKWIHSLIGQGKVKIQRDREGKRTVYKLSTVEKMVGRAIKRFRDQQL